MPKKPKHSSNGEKNDEAEDFGPYVDEKSDDQLNVDKVDFSSVNSGMDKDKNLRNEFAKVENDRPEWNSGFSEFVTENVEPERSSQPNWVSSLLERVAGVHR